MFGVALGEPGPHWVEDERAFQQANLAAIRQHPVTPFEDVTPGAGLRVTRLFRSGDEPDLRRLQLSRRRRHIGAIDASTGAIERLVAIKGPATARTAQVRCAPRGTAGQLAPGDLRSPDRRDAAERTGGASQPTVVKTVVARSGEFDWRDAGTGAAGVLGSGGDGSWSSRGRAAYSSGANSATVLPSGSRRYANRCPQNASQGFPLALEPGIDDAFVGRVYIGGVRTAEGEHDPLTNRGRQVRLDLPD